MIALILSLLTGIALAQESDVYKSSQAELERILRPHVVSLDRDLVLFRYEAKDPQRFNPKAQQDLIRRVHPWSLRFFNQEIVNNPDGGGPGLYTSTDPTATATWGAQSPVLFAMTLMKGSKVLIGERTVDNGEIAERAENVFRRMNCGDQRYNGGRVSDISDLVVQFRNATNVDCRRMTIEIFKKLEIRAITYSFYSTPFENCRATGTALNIIWPDALDLKKMNYYSDEIVIEGDKSLTPFVKSLFNDGKNYFVTQKQLANESMLQKFKDGFGFFEDARSAPPSAYEKWKSEHILRCGRVWPTEIREARAVLNLNDRHNADPKLQALMIKTAMAYRKRFADFSAKYGNDLIELEFIATRMRWIEELQYKQLEIEKYLSQDQWKKLKDSGQTDAIAERLGETFPTEFATFDKKLLAVLDKVEPRYYDHPLLLANLLLRLGSGSKVSHMTFNSFALGAGNIPILEGRIPSDLAADSRALLEHNYSLVTGIFQKCLAIYADPSVSNAAVTAGPCGVTNSSYAK